MKMVSLVCEKISGSVGASLVFRKEEGIVFDLPVLGNVGVGSFFNFIGYYIGACIVLYVLAKLLKNSERYSSYVKNTVLYSSSIVLLLNALELIIIMVISINLYECREIDYPNVALINVLGEIDDLGEELQVIFDAMLWSKVILCVCYFSYLFILLSVYLDLAEIKKFQTLLCLIVYCFVSYGFKWVSCNSFLYEIENINKCMVNIRSINNKLLYGDIDKIRLIKNDLDKFSGQYFYLSKNKNLAAQDRLVLYEMYLLLEYIGIVPEEEFIEPLVIGSKHFGMVEANAKYLNYIEKSLNCTSDFRLLKILRVDAEAELKTDDCESTFKIFLDKYHINKNKEISWLIVPMSFVKIGP